MIQLMAGLIYNRESLAQTSVITVSADVPALSGAGTSAYTVMTTQSAIHIILGLKATYQGTLMSKHTRSTSGTKLTNLPLDKMVAISQTTFLNAFSWMKMYEDFTEICS